MSQDYNQEFAACFGRLLVDFVYCFIVLEE